MSGRQVRSPSSGGFWARGRATRRPVRGALSGPALVHASCRGAAKKKEVEGRVGGETVAWLAFRFYIGYPCRSDEM